ncbi:hypothetical protein [Niallia circulans]|jgi:hypothetical protein|uniref:hypothetical protein n=1 Tax=Niallia circulans TaxID=1397 RepID=UPI003524038D
MVKINYRPLRKINSDTISGQIKHLLIYDVETLKYLRIYFVGSEKSGDSLYKLIAIMLSIFVFVNNIIIRDLTGWKLLLMNSAILVFTFLWVFLIRDIVKKHREEAIDLEIIDYCISFKEQHSDLDFIQLVDKFNEISANNVRSS